VLGVFLIGVHPTEWPQNKESGMVHLWVQGHTNHSNTEMKKKPQMFMDPKPIKCQSINTSVFLPWKK
jgi:hypothetical protein